MVTGPLYTSWMSVDVLVERRHGLNPTGEATSVRRAATGKGLEGRGRFLCAISLTKTKDVDMDPQRVEKRGVVGGRPQWPIEARDGVPPWSREEA